MSHEMQLRIPDRASQQFHVVTGKGGNISSTCKVVPLLAPHQLCLLATLILTWIKAMEVLHYVYRLENVSSCAPENTWILQILGALMKRS